jgi:hypothetical protein
MFIHVHGAGQHTTYLLRDQTGDRKFGCFTARMSDDDGGNTKALLEAMPS